MSNTPISSLSDDGVDVGRESRNITYLYGLSDFFSFMFEDTETLNLLLEANAVSASEIYSHFLQLTSSLSLESIQTFTGATIKLALIHPSDQPDETVPKYIVNVPIEEAKFLTNRPFLPTETLEEGVDYVISRRDESSSYIHFAKFLFDDPAPYKFSSRINSSGEPEIAIWMTDVKLDEQLVSKHFGSLIGIDPENSSEAFSSFVYGLYYIYLNGPTLGLLKRGLNLVLGAPLARANETVLDIRSYLASDQYLIITDQNQYLLPFGLTPSVNIDDEVSLGQLLAEWVELKDYTQDGEWWINVSIPSSIIPAVPPQQINRFAIQDSPYDLLMRNYLYKNSFLIRVNVGNFKHSQDFAQISDIINRAKPTHTQPVYIWSVPNDDTTLELRESNDTIKIEVDDIDHVGNPIELFRRNNLLSPVYRGGSYFLRRCVPEFASELVGEDPRLGQNQQNYFDAGGTEMPVSGIRAFKAGITPPTTYERAWAQAASAVGNRMWNNQANQYSALGTVTVTIPEGTPVYDGLSQFVPAGRRVICLYTTFLDDIVNKMTAVGLSVGPASNAVGFTIGGSGGYLVTTYAIFFNKTPNLGSLGPEFPSYSYQEFVPPISEIGPSDYLLIYKITSDVVGVYWVTTNTFILAPSLIPVRGVDPLELDYTVPLNRAGGITGLPFYMTRGGALENPGDIVGSYTDELNPTPIAINRSMGAPDWPTTGSLTLVNHRTRA